MSGAAASVRQPASTWFARAAPSFRSNESQSDGTAT